MSFLKNMFKNNIFKNIIVILSGDSVSTVLTLVCLSMLIRTVGLDQNGVLIMVQTYCLLFNDIFNFQSFNAIIKYLPYAIDNNDLKKIKEYIYQSFSLDVVTAIIATLMGWICLPFVAKFMHWDSSIILYIRIYLITVLMNLQGTAIGILRIYGRFNLVSYINVAIGFIKFIFYCICFFKKSPLFDFLIIETLGEVLRNVFNLIAAYRILKSYNVHKFYKEKFTLDKEFFVFNFYNNIIVTLDLPVNHITTFLINRYLGFADNSIYKVFQKIGGILQKISAPITQVVYPEFCKMTSKKNYKGAIKLCKKMFIYIFSIGIATIVFVLFTNKLWLWLLIPDPKGYVGLLIFYLGINVIIHSFMGLHPLFISLGFIKYNVPIIAISNILYLLYFFALVKYLGLTGVILAIAIQAIMVISLKILVIRKKRGILVGGTDEL